MRSVIVFVTDKNGIVLAEHAAAAALLTQKVTHYIIFLSGFAQSNESKLSFAATKLSKTVEYRTLPESRTIDGRYIGKGEHSHVSSAARLKMDALFSLRGEFDRALYIDNDVLLMKDFKLDELDFEGFPIASAYDIARVGGVGRASNFYERCRLNGLSPHYFNSGVIAADLAVFSPHYRKIYCDAVFYHDLRCGYEEKCSCYDQCAWNMTFSQNWKKLPISHNFQACAIFNAGWGGATARHYVGPQKFLPIKAWRNDSKDSSLIAEARKLLGLPTTKVRSISLIRKLNAIRNRRTRKMMEEALAKVDIMYQSSFSCCPASSVFDNVV